MAINRKWTLKELNSFDDLVMLEHEIRTLKPNIGAFDTESNGLHIIRCKPFLLQFGYITQDLTQGFAYAIDLEKHKGLIADITIKTFIRHFNGFKKVLAHNATYDMHMMANIGYPELFQHNISDTTLYIRLSNDAIAEKHGGAPLGLKDYVSRYIDSNAKVFERDLIAERELKKTLHNNAFKQKLISLTGRKWTIKEVDAILKDRVTGLDNIPENIRTEITKWLSAQPDPDNYQLLNRANVLKYALYDIVYTLETYCQTAPIIEERNQLNILKQEEELIPALYRMERVGFQYNTLYKDVSKAKLKAYIIRMRKRFQEMANSEITAGQHAKIKQILKDDYNVELKSTDKTVLDNIALESKSAMEFIKLIGALRNLEKFYTTYILQFENLEYNGRIYTTINQAGTVTGRVSSGFQQFPREGIKDDEGNELFHPRKLISVTGGKYRRIAFLDYAQIEMRFQAIYTVLVSGGDLNLCRMFIPFKCVLRDGKWYHEENPTVLWRKIDPHSMTATNVWGKQPSDQDWKPHRTLGKRGNFAINYGATPKRLAESLHITLETATRVYNNYFEMFPKVRDYKKYVQKFIDMYGYSENLFGRRYYGVNAHEASNYNVQGTAADFLKQRIIAVDRFLYNNKFKSRFQMNIHDELSFEIHDDDPKDLIFRIQEIMQFLPESPIPIEAEIEITESTWARKEDL